MCPIDDGVIKYDRSLFKKSPPLLTSDYSRLEKWREKLFGINLIGEYLPEKIGFGNLSQKKDYSEFFEGPTTQFLITGTQTGGFPHLDGNYYTRVLDTNLEKNTCRVFGPVEASSEALTHAAVYNSNPKITAVFHIHSKEIWKGMIEKSYPATSEKIHYGTIEMANAVEEITKSSPNGVIVMKGHDDGVISYGQTLDEAGELILKLYREFI